MHEEQGFEPSSPMSGEFTKALVDKMVAHGSDLRGIDEKIRKLPNPTAALEAMDQRLGELTGRLEKQDANFEKTGEELRKISQQLSLPAASIEQLRQQLEQHTQLFEKPLKKSIHYTHFLGRSMLVSAILIIIIMGLTILWNRAQIKANLHEENDIKWRQAKLTPDSLILKALEETDRAYLADPEGFRKAVVDEEERRQELFEQWQRVHQAAGEIERLEEKKKAK